MAEKHSIVSMHNIILIRLSVNGCFGCFHVLAVVNRAAVTIGVSVSFWIRVFSKYMLRSGISGSYLLLLLLFSHSVMCNSLQPHGLQHIRLPCPSLSPQVCSNSCPLSRWCHPALSPSVVPFSSCLQSFPASGSFPMSWLFTSGSQSIRASASVLPVNNQCWFSLGLTGLISLQSKGLSRVFSSITVWNHQFFGTQASLWSNYFFFFFIYFN